MTKHEKIKYITLAAVLSALIVVLSFLPIKAFVEITLTIIPISIGIIIGGKSVEHDISILSGLQVYHALNKDKYEPTIFYLTKENIWLTGKILEDLITYKNSNFNKCSQI